MLPLVHAQSTHTRACACTCTCACTPFRIGRPTCCIHVYIQLQALSELGDVVWIWLDDANTFPRPLPKCTVRNLHNMSSSKHLAWSSTIMPYHFIIIILLMLADVMRLESLTTDEIMVTSGISFTDYGGAIACILSLWYWGGLGVLCWLYFSICQLIHFCCFCQFLVCL